MSDTWIAALYQSIKNYLPWPNMWRCTPALRCKPVDTDDDIEFYSDYRYLEELLAALMRDVHLAKFEAPDIFPDHVGRPLLQAVNIPVESRKFWDDFGPWPPDYAASLLSLWRMDNEINAWMEHSEEVA